MNSFSIKDIENLCGIKAHTLRVWEQRYDFFCAKRKTSNHRIYDSDDLKLLLRISFLYHQGYKISKIAMMDKEALANAVMETQAGVKSELYVHRLVEAAIDFNQEIFEQLLIEAMEKMGMEKCIPGVFYPFLENIGCLWMTNHIIPAQEHFSSYLIQSKMIAALDRLEKPAREDLLVGICSLPGEYHEIPLVAVNYFLRSAGIRTVYFGVNVSPETVAYFHHTKKLTHLFFHTITNFTGQALEEYSSSFCRLLKGTTLLVSGPGAKNMDCEKQERKVLRSFDELRSVFGIEKK
jgi:DNA-binding transcriptional MerR regulator